MVHPIMLITSSCGSEDSRSGELLGELSMELEEPRERVLLELVEREELDIGRVAPWES